MIMDIQEIKKYIPQRYPLLMVDRVVELVAGESIKAYKNISANEDVFNGHFPNAPIFPGVMIIEAMAQTASILAFKSDEKTPDDGSTLLFAAVDGVRFKRPVVPGDRLDLEVSIITSRRGITKFDTRALVDGELAASATITCAERKV